MNHGSSLKKVMFFGLLLVSVVGTLWHFVYEWTGNNFLIGFLAPINESTFEHMKLVFFPSLLYLPIAVPILKREIPDFTERMSCGIIRGTWFLPIFFYTYSGILGRNIMAVDIASFYFSVLIVFLGTYRLAKAEKKVSVIWFYLLFVMVFLFVCFTYRNCGVGIFEEP